MCVCVCGGGGEECLREGAREGGKKAGLPGIAGAKAAAVSPPVM